MKRIMVLLLAVAMLGTTGSTALGQSSPKPSLTRMKAISNQRAHNTCLASERIDPITGYKTMECVSEFNRVDACYNTLPGGRGYCEVHMQFLIKAYPGDPSVFVWYCVTSMEYRQIGTTL